MRGAERGWLAIAGVAAIHNIIQAGRGKELLSEAARRWRRRHPILVPVLSLGLWAHLMGWLPRWMDPLYMLGVVAESLRR